MAGGPRGDQEDAGTEEAEDEAETGKLSGSVARRWADDATTGRRQSVRVLLSNELACWHTQTGI
jgi:hypothetical protein